MECNKCSRDGQRCVWRLIRKRVKRAIPTVNAGENNLKRKMAYRIAVREIYGRLGAGVRKQLPECVVRGVRQLYPSDNDEYMGFRES